MKLPQMQYGGRVSGAGTIGPGAAVSQARSEQAVLDAGIRVGQQIAEQKIEHDTARANAAYRDEIVGLQTALAQRDELTRDELIALGADEANPNIRWTDADGNEVQTFKKYEVEAALMSQVMEDRLEQAGSNIASSRYRQAWQQAIREENQNEILRITQRSAKDAEAYEEKLAIAELEALAANPEAQLEYAKTTPAIDPDTRQRYINQATTAVFEQDHNNILNNGTDEEVKAHIENLKDPEYREASGVSERRMQVLTNRAEAELNQRNREAERLAALAEGERLEVAKDAFDRLAAAQRAGVTISDENMEDTLAATRGTPYYEEVQRADRVSQFMHLDYETRVAALESANNFDTAEDYGAMAAANDALNKAVVEDGFTVAAQQELINPEPMVPGSLQDPQWVNERMRQAEIATSHYGYPVSPFTQDEVNRISVELNTMSSSQQARMAMAFNEMPPSIWKQFHDSGATVFAWTGAAGDSQMAQIALRGQQAIDNKTVILPSENEMLAASADYLGDVYGIEDKRSVINTARAIYADIAPVGTDGQFDADSWETALEMATGGISSVNGAKVAIPRGTDPDVMQDYVDTFSAEDVRSFGGVDGYTDEQAADLIRDARWKSVGEGQYRIDIGNTTLMSRGQPFIVIYDEQASLQQRATDYSIDRQRSQLKLMGGETAQPWHFRR